jgi:hypothetical protein
MHVLRRAASVTPAPCRGLDVELTPRTAPCPCPWPRPLPRRRCSVTPPASGARRTPPLRRPPAAAVPAVHASLKGHARAAGGAAAAAAAVAGGGARAGNGCANGEGPIRPNRAAAAGPPAAARQGEATGGAAGGGGSRRGGLSARPAVPLRRGHADVRRFHPRRGAPEGGRARAPQLWARGAYGRGRWHLGAAVPWGRPRRWGHHRPPAPLPPRARAALKRSLPRQWILHARPG